MFNEFRQQITRFESVGVFSHIRPDGDCIGAQVALCIWLEKNGIRAMAFNDYELSQNLKWLSRFHPVERPDSELTAQCDAFVVVDGNAPARFGSYEQYQNDHPRPAFMIDHHPEPADVFNLSVSVEEASSTCELIYKLFMEHDESQIDVNVAKALYTGIITDTGSMQYDSVTPETVETVADLLRRGNFRPGAVLEKVFSNRSPQQLKLLSLSLNSIELYENNQIAIMYVTKEMLDKTNTTSDDCEGLVNYPLSIAGVKAAVFLKDIDDGVIRMSLRSRGDLDVNEWAKELEGGGHRKAAGARHPGPLSSAISDVVKIGVKQLKKIEHSNILS
ncbi:MAG: bifunctional oligoribonuclease/PAP phosphatase NrnA [Balneolaceae bacterium]